MPGLAVYDRFRSHRTRYLLELARVIADSVAYGETRKKLIDFHAANFIKSLLVRPRAALFVYCHPIAGVKYLWHSQS